jgi:hypothetical protein
LSILYYNHFYKLSRSGFHSQSEGFPTFISPLSGNQSSHHELPTAGILFSSHLIIKRSPAQSVYSIPNHPFSYFFPLIFSSFPFISLSILYKKCMSIGISARMNMHCLFPVFIYRFSAIFSSTAPLAVYRNGRRLRGSVLPCRLSSFPSLCRWRSDGRSACRLEALH